MPIVKTSVDQDAANLGAAALAARISPANPLIPLSILFTASMKFWSCPKNSTATVPAFNGAFIIFTFSVVNLLAFTINMMYNTGV